MSTSEAFTGSAPDSRDPGTRGEISSGGRAASRLRNRLLFRIFLPFAALLIGAQSLAILSGQRRVFQEEKQAELDALLGWLEPAISLLWDETDPAPLRDWIENTARGAPFRLTVVGPDGRVIADNEADPDRMENHAARPEMAAALAGSRGVGRRFSFTRRRSMIYVARPVRDGDRVLGAARAALPRVELDRILFALRRQILAGAAVLLALAGVLGFAISRSVSIPVERMRDAAGRIADGDLTVRLPEPPTGELASLARAANHMVDRLQDQIREVGRMSKLQQAAFEGMSEGLLQTDAAGRVAFINRAAASLLGAEAGAVLGRPLMEAGRDILFERLYARARGGERAAGELAAGPGNRLLRIRAEPVRESGRVAGVLFLCEDITRQRRLETVRQEFVSNVSHEIRTPLSVIKSYAETLRDSPLSSEQARRFVETIVRQADRMEALVEDLLRLTRLDHLEHAGGPERERRPVLDIVRAAAGHCGERAKERGIEILVTGDPSVRADVAPTLLERAVANLLDNAIEFSDPGSPVEAALREEPGAVRIEVRDRGPGIPAVHLPRLFERFYRVDKARSRKSGGTGLGLAIVKHIAQAHRGRVEVRSEPGRGSCFSIILPRPPPGEPGGRGAGGT